MSMREAKQEAKDIDFQMSELERQKAHYDWEYRYVSTLISEPRLRAFGHGKEYTKLYGDYSLMEGLERRHEKLEEIRQFYSEGISRLYRISAIINDKIERLQLKIES